MQQIKDFSQYIKKVSDNYNKKSITDVLNNFRLLTPEYQQFNEVNSDENKYSSNDYLKCNKEEQSLFAKDQLSIFESLVANSIYDSKGLLYGWKEIFDLIRDPNYALTDKIKRKVVYASRSNNRPVGENAVVNWNGMQIIDLDIKNEKLAEELKYILFEELSKYHWFLGVCKSASKKSLHVWTKITPLSVNITNLRTEYLCNFRHKYSYIYIVLSKYKDKFDLSDEIIESFLDMAMAKPQQGIFISSDSYPLMSTNFKDLRMDVNFEPALDMGIESIDWISHPNLKRIFAKLEWFNNESFDTANNVEISDVSNINDRDASKNKKIHYKHNQRWQLANTLTNLYGFDKALKYMLEICKDTPYRELRGDVKTAEIHNKPISIWAIKRLNDFHGFNIKLENSDIYDNESKIDSIDNTEVTEQNTGLNNISNKIEFFLNKNQYLSDISDKIFANLGHLTLLEAGAGYGKTEMIKQLKAKTCLILPFTSTIKAKIEKSEVTEGWLYYYGNKRPALEDLLGNKNMAMTIDKFSRLNVMELDQANFEYIVLDESHLIFTSSYRDVMAPTIQRLANCKAKIILMTGTPTGELTFFPGIKHIKITKEDTRVKDFEVHFCESSTEQTVEMCKMMAEDIKAGRKILFPTNDGNLYYEEIVGLIQDILNKETNYGTQLKSFYYKKSNYGDDSMDDINFNKTIGRNDLIACTTYLSVGVDICDKYDFSVYFNKLWIAQDIEQFANRLRNNNLHVKLFLPRTDSSGYPINYWITKPLDLSFSKNELLLIRDLVRTCNDMIERNNDELKSNPMIQSLISSNKFLKYDENQCKYFIDETTYKLKIFEERYSEYNTQLSILLKGMKYYGYDVSYKDHKNIVSEEYKAELDEYIKGCRKKRYNEITNQTFDLISKMNDNNIELYREVIKGNLDLIKGKDSYNTKLQQENNLYVQSIEILEKNVPIILSLYRYYDINVIKEIYTYCLDTKQNRINFTKLNRIRRFVHIASNIKKNKLDFPIYKFVVDSKNWALQNPITTSKEIKTFLINYTVKIANNIKDVIVEDNLFLEKLYEKITELWKIIIIEKNVNKEVMIEPFKLLWQKKDIFDDLYGGSATRQFFLDELVDNIKVEDDFDIDENTELPELDHTSKLSLESVKSEIENTVKAEYDYYDYSEADGSNDRFMEKQRNTNMLRDTIFNNDNDEEEQTNDNLIF